MRYKGYEILNTDNGYYGKKDTGVSYRLTPVLDTVNKVKEMIVTTEQWEAMMGG